MFFLGGMQCPENHKKGWKKAGKVGLQAALLMTDLDYGNPQKSIEKTIEK
jgi:hypothetical protein